MHKPQSTAVSAGKFYQTILIYIIDDCVVEHNETFTVGISSRDSRVIIAEDNYELMVVILDDDGMYEDI